MSQQILGSQSRSPLSTSTPENMSEKSGCHSEVKLAGQRYSAIRSSMLKFDSFYQSTSIVESSRLIMIHFKNSKEEIKLVRDLNLEIRA